MRPAPTTPGTISPSAASTPFYFALWVAQIIAAGLFCMAGILKLTTPIAGLSAMMPWTGELSPVFVRIMGIIDLAGGIGLILPSLTRIFPRLTVVAAMGCIVLQPLASAFHALRGEFTVLPLNALLLALTVFIYWGRRRKAPIDPRR